MVDKSKIESGVSLILDGLGVDRKDENYIDTPKRVARAYQELCSGLDEDIRESLFSKSFPCTHQEMVFIGDIKAVSVCPHHLLPVIIRADVGYLPKKRVIGLSKIPRLVHFLAARPILQEQLTSDLADSLVENLDVLGCGVIIRARHLCMEVRGVKQSRAVTITSAVRGHFKENSDVKQEFFELGKLSRKEI